MKPVNQKVIDAKEGDCLGACIASILEIEQYPNFHTTKSGSWLDNWNKYLSDFNLQIIEYPLGSFPVPIGYAILAVKSALFQGVRHAVVFHGDGYFGKIVHNPNPNDQRGIDIPNEDWLSFKVLALVDPSKVVGQNHTPDQEPTPGTQPYESAMFPTSEGERVVSTKWSADDHNRLVSLNHSP